MKKLSLFLRLGAFAALALWIVPALGIVNATRVGDAAYTVAITDVRVYTSVAFTAARTWTLPNVGATCIGQTCQPPANVLEIHDIAAAITGTNTLTIAPASGETINGNAANLIISAAGTRVVLVPASPSNWQATVYGDYRTAAVLDAGAVALTTTAAKTIATISLSQGVWDCNAALSRKLAASTSVTRLTTSISATTDTAGTADLGTMKDFATAANVMATNFTDTIGPIRLSLAATTNQFLVAADTFTVSTNSGFGHIFCRRPR